MRSRLAITFVLAFVPLASASARAAERVAVLPFSGVNVHPGYLQAAQSLLRDHLVATGRFAAVAVAGQPPSAELPVAEMGKQGQAASADLVAAGHITHVQSVSRIRVCLYEVATGSLRYDDTLGSSGGPDEMDTILKRLASGAAHGERASGNAELDTVTVQEAEAPLKVTATRSVGLRLGTIVPLNRPAGEVAAAPGLGVSWLYDARAYLAELFVDYYNSPSSKQYAFDVGVGLYYPLGRRNWSPYVGGGAAYSIESFGGAGANGLRFHGAVGVLLGRLSTVQMRGELGYFINSFTEKASATGETALSHGPQLTLAVGF